MRCNTLMWHGDPSKQPENGGCGAKIFRIILLRFNRAPTDVFPAFRAELPRYEEMRVHSTRCKNMHLFAAVLRPASSGRQNFNT